MVYFEAKVVAKSSSDLGATRVDPARSGLRAGWVDLRSVGQAPGVGQVSRVNR